MIRNDIEKNSDLWNGDVSSGICLINSHSLYQFNESSNLNDIIYGVENGAVSGGHFYI